MYCIFDAHSDTMDKILRNEKNLHFDIEKACASDIDFIQVFAAWATGENSYSKVNDIIDRYFLEVKKKNIIHLESIEDIEKYSKTDGIKAFLSIEGGDAIDSIETLNMFYEKGVRILTLTWNYKNKIADGILEESGEGLSCFGKKVVSEMNKIGMAIDVSHLSEKGFWGVAEISEKPFIASHSNAKSICGHKRNLSDTQIKELIRKKGFIGVNFYPLFLTDGVRCDIKDIIKHIEHILSLGGENNIGFGSDFDGVDCLPDGIEGAQDYYKIIDELLKIGYSEELIKKISCENFINVLKSIFNK